MICRLFPRFRIIRHLHDFGIQAHYNRLRGMRRREDAEPSADVESWQCFGDCRHVGQLARTARAADRDHAQTPGAHVRQRRGQRDEADLRFTGYQRVDVFRSPW
jgi:hypothetical protein